MRGVSRAISASALFATPPTIEFRPEQTRCPECRGELNALKTRVRKVSTLHVGGFIAKETILECRKCERAIRSARLGSLVPSGAKFGYDVMVHVGEALFIRHRNEEETAEELAQKNVHISLREVSLLGMKFAVYLAIAHRRAAGRISREMKRAGGFVCHLDATCEGGEPILMSGIDSLSEIVLDNVKLPSEHQDHIIPFLRRIKSAFGIPLAVAHDMGRALLKAVGEVFPGVPDFICHFHFLRDIGNDFFAKEYDVIRGRLRAHEIRAKLRYRAKQLKKRIAWGEKLDEFLSRFKESPAPDASLTLPPCFSVFSLIRWALLCETDSGGYGFPFDRPHLSFALRVREIYAKAQQLRRLPRSAGRKENMPYVKLRDDLRAFIADDTLWRSVRDIERKIVVFDRLRNAMRIAPAAGGEGLNDRGGKDDAHTIERRVRDFRAWLTSRPDYGREQGARDLIAQLDKYWEKLFADPIEARVAGGVKRIQPQRTNNIMEHFFRKLKRAHRRRTGESSAARMLRSMLAETPLAQNLRNPRYMRVLLDGADSLEDVFAGIDVREFREQFQKARAAPDKIPGKLKPLIAMPDYPGKLLSLAAGLAADRG